jgi:hypothetical protein
VRCSRGRNWLPWSCRHLGKKIIESLALHGSTHSNRVRRIDGYHAARVLGQIDNKDNNSDRTAPSKSASGITCDHREKALANPFSTA